MSYMLAEIGVGDVLEGERCVELFGVGSFPEAGIKVIRVRSLPEADE